MKLTWWTVKVSENPSLATVQQHAVPKNINIFAFFSSGFVVHWYNRYTKISFSHLRYEVGGSGIDDLIYNISIQRMAAEDTENIQVTETPTKKRSRKRRIKKKNVMFKLPDINNK